MLDEVVSQRTHQLNIAWWIGGAYVVNRLDQAGAQQIGDVAIDEVAGKVGIGAGRDPVGENSTAVQGAIRRLGVSRLTQDVFRYFAGVGVNHDHRRSAKPAVVRRTLRPNLAKEVH